MDEIINELKQHLYARADQLRTNLDDDEIKRDCIALVEAVNILEQRAYGRMITTLFSII
ncbi:hypothetical protein J2Z23_000191 [Lederbergia galactosidilyticus]|nr:hypothetical protein [Lederbergia galactosidilytica]